MKYRSAGTVEFVYDTDANKFYFLEVNTRLQVEHGVTEEVTGVDLVEWMVRCAAGEMNSLASLKPNQAGHSIQVRVYAEDPGKNFQPSAGLLTEADFSANARVETWVERGTEVTPFYDPLLAKLIVSGGTRAEALTRLREALASTSIAGIETNLGYLRQITASDSFRARWRDHALSGIAGVRSAHHRSARRRHHDHGAGLPGTDRLLASRRAAFGPDGLAFVPPGKSPAGK